ncbi:uncharacterized protein [Eurosta solidaginis]|uniref:uncharacterized protein n=1 Tax=Eurosta solidaginis TaxID=178769 RepID=UPI0035309FE8
MAAFMVCENLRKKHPGILTKSKSLKKKPYGLPQKSSSNEIIAPDSRTQLTVMEMDSPTTSQMSQSNTYTPITSQMNKAKIVIKKRFATDGIFNEVAAAQITTKLSAPKVAKKLCESDKNSNEVAVSQLTSNTPMPKVLQSPDFHAIFAEILENLKTLIAKQQKIDERLQNVE